MIQDVCPAIETDSSVRVVAGPTLENMFTTMLTKRRAVDHCRTRSSLCRMS